MRVGYITQWFPPERGSAALPGTIVAALADQGLEVDVVTGYPNYPEGQLQAGWRQRLFRTDFTGSAIIHRTPIFVSHDDRAWRRMLNYVSFAISATVTAILRLRRSEVVWVHATPIMPALPAMALNRVCGIPFIIHIQDLWPDTVFASGMLPKRVEKWGRRPLEWFCHASYRQAAAVAVIAPGMKTALVERGVSPSKIVEIPNWADESIFSPARPLDVDRRGLGLHDGFVAMYAGAMGDVQGLETIVKAASHLKGRPDIQVALVGDGVARAKLEALASSLELDNIVFVPPQPLASMSAVMASAETQIICLSDLPLYRITLPSKVQATLAAGRPVIVSAGGDAGDVVAAAGAGIPCPPGDDEALALAILAMADTTSAERERWGTSGADYYREHLSQAVGVRRMMASLEYARANGGAL